VPVPAAPLGAAMATEEALLQVNVTLGNLCASQSLLADKIQDIHQAIFAAKSSSLKHLPASGWSLHTEESQFVRRPTGSASPWKQDSADMSTQLHSTHLPAATPMLSFARAASRTPEDLSLTFETQETKNPGDYTLAADEGLHHRSGNGFVAATLPLHWPSCLEKRTIGDSTPMSRSLSTRGRKVSLRTMSASSEPSGPSDQSNQQEKSFRDAKPWYILHPYSKRRIVLDVVASIMLCYDLVATPFALSWSLNVRGWLLVSYWCSSCFWVADMLFSFLSGYIGDGQVVLNPSKIRHRYIRTWLIPDVMMVSCDIGSLLAGVAEQSSKTFRLFRLSRALRIVSVLRVLRIFPRVEEFLERYRLAALADQASIMFLLVRVIFYLLFANHLIACGWYAIGAGAQTDTGLRWLDGVAWQTDSGREVTYAAAQTVYQYAFSFHWALVQVTLGSSHIVAVSTAESLYATVCLIFGLLMGTSLISVFSAQMVDAQTTTRQKFEKLKLLRRFLRQNKIGGKLTAEVLQVVTIALRRKMVLNEEDVNALSLLPLPLLSEVHFHVCDSPLLTFPLFRIWSSFSRMVTVRFCMDAVSLCYYPDTYEVFSAGVSAEETYLIHRGVAGYVQQPETSPVRATVDTDVNSSTWLAEAAIWVHWVYVGTLKLRCDCQVLVIKCAGVFRAIEKNVMLSELCIEYGKAYHAQVIRAVPPIEYPTDLHVPGSSFEEVVLNLPPQVTIAIGQQAVEVLLNRNTHGFSITTAVADGLRREIVKGRSVLTIDGKGVPRCLVRLVVFKIFDGDSPHAEEDEQDILVQVGELTAQRSIKAVLKLPGGKQELGEEEDAATTRLMSQKLAPLACLLDTYTIDYIVKHDVIEEESKSTNVHTKYARMICTLKMSQASFEASLTSVLCPADLANITTSVSIPAHVGTNGKHRSNITTAGILDSRPCYVFRCADNTNGLYMWITAGEFETLQRAPHSKANVVSMLSNMDIADLEQAGLKNDELARRQLSIVDEAQEAFIAPGEPQSLASVDVVIQHENSSGMPSGQSPVKFFTATV